MGITVVCKKRKEKSRDDSPEFTMSTVAEKSDIYVLIFFLFLNVTTINSGCKNSGGQMYFEK